MLKINWMYNTSLMCSVISAGVSSCKNILQLSVDGVYPEKSHGAPSQLDSYWSMFLTETSDWLSHPPSEYNLSPFPSVAKEYTSTSQKIKQFFSFLNIQKLYCHSYVMIKSEASVQVTWCLQFTGVVTSLWSWLAASPCPLSGWSSPVSSASAPVCWTAMGEMKDWLIYSHTTWSGQKWYLFQRKHVSNKIRLVFNCKLEPHLVCLSLHFLPPGAGLLGVKKLPLETVGNKIVLRR